MSELGGNIIDKIKKWNIKRKSEVNEIDRKKLKIINISTGKDVSKNVELNVYADKIKGSE